MMKLMFIFISLLFMSCTPTAEENTSSGVSCVNSADCPSRELCLEKSCQNVDCVSSVDCDLEEFCNKDYECKSGCKEDSDCLAGYTCNVDERECQSYGCRNTELDCAVGEFCNPSTAECYSDGVDYCQLCTADEYNSNLPDGVCLADSEGGSCEIDLFGQESGCTLSEVCLPDSQFSITGTCYTVFKALYLSVVAQGECPGGFYEDRAYYSDGWTCSSDSDCQSGGFCYNGSCLYATDPICIGNCQYFIENGYLQ